MKIKILMIVALVLGFIIIKSIDRDVMGNKHEVPKAIKKWGGDFTLKSFDGPISLKKINKKLNLIYFGYTFCPDVCPTSLTFMAGAFKKMSKKQLNQIQGLFITVDPKRDTLEILKNYSPYFHKSIMGLSGTIDEIKSVADQYGVYFHIHESQKNKKNYSVDHSSSTYLVTHEGQLLHTFSHGTKSNEIYKKILEYL